ncbi:antitoxin VapB family protein [Candidatus Woesearchaeota archaeon]|nr:antitoxin VapB family protein [Candidatus Woesearchaeota archaeon]
MATKTISITEDAYERLAALKNENESFSEVIGRITLKPKLSDFHGVLSKESADKLEKSIKELRKEHSKSHEKRVERIRKELKWSA